MKNAIRISIEKPCTEKFENFNQTSVGGFCDSCQKEVIDFTTMTSKEIVKYFSLATGETCGRFTTSQLKTHEPINKNNANNSFVSRGVSIMSFSLLSLCANQAQAQEIPKVKPLQTEQHMTVGDVSSTHYTANQTHTVTGTVVDEDNLTLAGTSINLKGSTEGTVTDFDGRFTFPRALNVNDTLIFSYIGYETKQYMIKANDTNAINLTLTLDINLDALEDIIMMGAVDVDGVYESKPNIFQKFRAIFK